MSAPAFDQSRRLWSLWDMLKLTAEKFSRALMDFTTMRNLLSQITTLSAASVDRTLDDASVQSVITILAKVEDELEPIGAPFTCKALRDLKAKIEGGEHRAFILSPLAFDIERRLQDELESISLFIIDRKDADFYDGASQFLDAEAQQAFPTAITDGEEASRCLALGLHTASVFHVMRAAEAAVGELARAIGATHEDKNGETLAWGILASNIGDAIRQLPAGPSRDDWHQAHMFLVSCNRAFRTKTAHPVHTYTEGQAKEAFEATRSFINSVARLV